MTITAEQFLFFKNYILTKNRCDDILKEMLLDESNYTIDEDTLHINSDEFWENFVEELNKYVLQDNIVETTYEFENEFEYNCNYVSKVRERYFYHTNSYVYGFLHDTFSEVFPVKVKIKAYKFSDGCLTNDTLEIIE